MKQTKLNKHISNKKIISFMVEFGSKCLQFCLQINFLKYYLADLPIIYCHKGLHATCFQGSIIHL